MFPVERDSDGDGVIVTHDALRIAHRTPCICRLDLPRFQCAEEQVMQGWDETNVIATDTSIGYQVPRLWFPHAHPGGSGRRSDDGTAVSAGVSMPQPRARPSGGADRPIGSDAVVEEYQQMQAFRAYRRGYQRFR